jgi:cytoskeleton protein RodZ
MTKVTQLNLDPEGEPANKRRIHLREISGDSDKPLETVGQDLRAARLRKGDDLATVSRALKIRKDHLEAIEEDDLSGLPGKTYAVGFVRSYSAYLGLDAVHTVARFKAEISGRPEEGAVPVNVIDDDEQRRLPRGWRIIAGVVVLLLAYGGYRMLAGDHPAPAPVPPPPAQYAPRPMTAATTPPPAATPRPAAPKPAAPAPTTVAAVAPAKPTAPAVTGQVYGEQNKGARVVLRARGDTHITVRGTDGRTFINRVLKAGDIYQLPNIVGLTLATTNAGAVEIDLDGLAMGRAGGDLETTGGISLDPQAIVDRYNGHG